MSQRKPPPNDLPVPSGAGVPDWWTTAYDEAWRMQRDQVLADAVQPSQDAPEAPAQAPTEHFPWRFRGAMAAIRLAESETAAATAGAAPSRDDGAMAEQAARYGYAAFSRFGGDHAHWDERPVELLEQEWRRFEPRVPFAQVDHWVKRGWNAARRRRQQRRQGPPG